MNIKHLLGLLALSIGALAHVPAHAILVSDNSLFGPVVEDFSGYDVLITSGPQALGGGITLTSSIDSTLGANVADLGDNGTWGINKFAGIGDLSGFGSSATVGSITLALSTPASGVGAFMSHYSDATAAFSITLEALGAGGAVLETQSFTYAAASSSAFNAGSFAGIGRLSQDITALRISGDGFVLDGVQLATAPIPEPSTYAMIIAGLGLLGFAGKRGLLRK